MLVQVLPPGQPHGSARECEAPGGQSTRPSGPAAQGARERCPGLPGRRARGLVPVRASRRPAPRGTWEEVSRAGRRVGSTPDLAHHLLLRRPPVAPVGGSALRAPCRAGSDPTARGRYRGGLPDNARKGGGLLVRHFRDVRAGRVHRGPPVRSEQRSGPARNLLSPRARPAGATIPDRPARRTTTAGIERSPPRKGTPLNRRLGSGRKSRLGPH